MHAFQRGFARQLGLLRGLCLRNGGISRGKSLRCIGHRLLGCGIGATNLHHLATQALDPAAGVGLGIGKLLRRTLLFPLLRIARRQPPDAAACNGQYQQKFHENLHFHIA